MTNEQAYAESMRHEAQWQRDAAAPRASFRGTRFSRAGPNFSLHCKYGIAIPTPLQESRKHHVEIIGVRNKLGRQASVTSAFLAARSAPERRADKYPLLRRLPFGFAHGTRRMA